MVLWLETGSGTWGQCRVGWVGVGVGGQHRVGGWWVEKRD